MKQNIDEEERSRGSGIYWEKLLTVYEYDFLKSYLHAVYSKTFVDERIKIFRCVTHTSLSHRPQMPATLDAGSSTFRIVGDGVLEVTATWLKKSYEINVSKETLNDGSRVHHVYCLGLSDKSSHPRELVDYCLFQAVSNSFFKNQILRLTKPIIDEAMQIKPIEVKGRNLEEILLPFECIEAINLFIQTLRHFDHIHRPLRFLLNGKPGTGKTETVRSIIEACKGYATFLLVEGRCELREVFELASFFTPAVVCLDDIDLSFGNRLQSVDRHRLGDFLNLMDGFNKNNIFVLATTNDKDWVDVAASRPGRFDMILDVNLLEPSLYLELIRQRCPNEEIIRLFDDSILEEMKEKKVSGAFVVNLIKHIEIKHALNHVTLDSGHVRDAIEKMYRGFYKRVNEGEVIGFAAN